MSMSDPIADMLTRMRNALEREHATVSMPDSKVKRALAQVMKDEGYIEDFQVLPATPQSTLRISLKYTGGRRDRESVVTAMQRVSKPGRRVYVGRKEIPWVLNGMGVAIVSTPQGLMSDQQARRKGVGGEVICKIW